MDEGSGYKEIIPNLQVYPVWPKNDAFPLFEIIIFTQMCGGQTIDQE
jgi:hypothetical protein